MQSPYENDAGAKGYLDFLASDDGQIFKQVLSENILKRLADKPGLTILDAGCGPGWLAKILMDRGHKVKACDISPQLIEKAKADYPDIDFQIADLTKTLPYENNQFDCAILSLSALDLSDQKTAFSEIKRVLKEKGILIIITVNPYCGFPVGVWKRGIIGRLLMKKPTLKLRPYFDFQKKTDRSFTWNGNLTSYFYALPEQINLLINAGFALQRLDDITAPEDDKKYSLQYRLYRFPIFILLEFLKP